jgi:hypothetical protein
MVIFQYFKQKNSLMPIPEYQGNKRRGVFFCPENGFFLSRNNKMRRKMKEKMKKK